MNSSVDLRDSVFKLKTNHRYLNSPTLLLNKIDILSKDRRAEQKLKSIAKLKLERLKENDGGDLLSVDYSNLFDSNLESLAKKHFDSEKISDDNIQRYIFAECMLQAKKARTNGKKSVRYSFLLIRFAISLRLKLGNDKYEYLAKTFNLPSGRTINNFSSPDTNSPDGIMFNSLEAERKNFNSKFLSAGITDWVRHGILC